MLPVILLHGALGAASDLSALAEALGGTVEVHVLDFPGHGAAQMPERPFDLRYFSEEVLRFMNETGVDRAHVFGYSMGGCVGMLAAGQSPERIASVATLGTKYLWNEEASSAETRKLDPDKMEAKVPAFASSLSAMHGAERWKEMVHRTRAMIGALGVAPPFPKPESDFAGIQQPCLVMVGDRDAMVPVEETRQVQLSLPNASLAVLPNTPHPINKVDPDVLAFHLRRFFAEVEAGA